MATEYILLIRILKVSIILSAPWSVFLILENVMKHNIHLNDLI